MNITLSTYAKNKNPDSLYISEDEIIGFLGENKPDVIINERSNGLEIQNKVNSFCRNHNILNICILDVYGGYDKRFEVAPHKIIVPSKSTYTDLCSFGFPVKDLYIGGNASFDRFDKYIYDKAVNIKKPHVIYTSQGFDRLYVLEKFYNIFKDSFTEFSIDIKTHPQESDDKWKGIIHNYKNVKLLDFDNRNDFLNECLKYDMIIGHNSTLQIQAYLIGIPVIFYELGNIDEAIIKFKQGETPLQIHPYGDFEKNATEKTIRIIEEIISSH